MEILFALAIFGLAIAGLALGVMLGRAPVKSSCGASEGLPDSKRCEDCPNRIRRAADD
ncbi:MAG: hypothetical protein Q4G36_12810 [Paracoccus sp. (in: a-proteobacteria)]|nr:hypothetical protein [Paracoccus sp. (in: a-proteobacteria)]